MHGSHTEHHVVLIPGFTVAPKHCAKLRAWCDAQGMTVHTFDYPVREWRIERAALMLATYVDTDVLEDTEGRSVSFVAIEYGTLICRYFMSHFELLPARRCVFITDPWHPSDAYRTRSIGWRGRRRFGEPLVQLAEGPHGFVANCNVPPVPYGVIVTDTTLREGDSERKNDEVRGSVFASPYVLEHAQDVMYEARSCRAAIRHESVHKYIGAFLTHGWFTER